MDNIGTESISLPKREIGQKEEALRLPPIAKGKTIISE